MWSPAEQPNTMVYLKDPNKECSTKVQYFTTCSQPLKLNAAKTDVLHMYERTVRQGEHRGGGC